MALIYGKTFAFVNVGKACYLETRLNLTIQNFNYFFIKQPNLQVTQKKIQKRNK